MSQRIGAYLHPWDLTWLADRGGLPALGEMGCTDVAFPASYHAGRWMTPVGGEGLVRLLEDGITYFRPGDSYGVLQPTPSASIPVSGNSPLEECIEQATAAGLESHAWTVLFHNTPMGQRHPESCVINAVGDAYEYSLCPARPEVQEFGLAMVRDVAAHANLTTVEVEAMGYMGYKHGSHHAKSSFTPDPYLDFLLSFCFCEHCVEGLQQQLVEGDLLRAKVAGLLREHIVEGDAMQQRALSWQESFDQLTKDLGRRPFLGMIRHRTQIYVGLLSRLRGVIPSEVRLSVHLNMDPLFSGSQIGHPFNAIVSMVDEIIVTHYGESTKKMSEKWRGQKGIGARTRVAIWPKAPEYTEDKDLVAVLNLAEEWHLDGVRIYHLGLLPWRTTQRVFKVLTS